MPKAEELVATPYRHGSKEKAEAFFLDGMTQAMHRLAEQAHPAFPVTIYYAFKQAESESDEGTASTGWETFLDAVIRAGFAISGTWPMRTEHGSRMIEIRHQRPRLQHRPRLPPARGRCAHRHAPRVRHRAQGRAAAALAHLQRGNIAPVDLAQAAIGPGMAVYTRYAQVLDAAGKPLSVREALGLINQTLDEVLAEQEGDFDADSRWALAWFEQSGFAEGEFGVADVLAKAKNTQCRRAGRGWHRGVEGREGPAPSAERAARRLGSGGRHAADRVGDGSPPVRALEAGARRRGRAGQEARQRRPRSPASWPIGSTRSASGRSGLRRPSPTTPSSRAGPRSRASLGRAERRAARKPASSRAHSNDLLPISGRQEDSPLWKAKWAMSAILVQGRGSRNPDREETGVPGQLAEACRGVVSPARN